MREAAFNGMNPAAFVVIAIITLSGALAAATLPRLIHAALSLVIVFVGVAAYFLLLGAEFVGLVQIFVYIGAVAVLIVFTILLTRRDIVSDRGINWGGVIVALAVFGGLLWIILHDIARASRAAIRASHGEADWRITNDQLRLAAAMRRPCPHRRAYRSPHFGDGGENRTLNALQR